VSIRRTLRSTIKWGGAAVTVLVLVVWVGSAWWSPYVVAFPNAIARVYGSSIAGVGLRKGQLIVIVQGDWTIQNLEFEVGTQAYAHTFSWQWWFDAELLSGSTVLFVPLWFLALLTATPTFLIWRRDRKRLPGACSKCGYSRTGLPADRACPECGVAVPGVTPQASHS